MDTMTEVALDDAYIGRQIRGLRKKYGWTLDYFGKRLKRIDGSLPEAKNILSKIENGNRTLSAVELVRFALALDVTPNRLLFGRPVDPAITIENNATNPFLYLSEHVGVSLLNVWYWADGGGPLGPGTEEYKEPEDVHEIFESMRRRDQAFGEENRPLDKPLDVPMKIVLDLEDDGTLPQLLDAVKKARAHGMNTHSVTEYIERRRASTIPSNRDNSEDDDG